MFSQLPIRQVEYCTNCVSGALSISSGAGGSQRLPTVVVTELEEIGMVTELVGIAVDWLPATVLVIDSIVDAADDIFDVVLAQHPGFEGQNCWMVILNTKVNSPVTRLLKKLPNDSWRLVSQALSAKNEASHVSILSAIAWYAAGIIGSTAAPSMFSHCATRHAE